MATYVEKAQYIQFVFVYFANSLYKNREPQFLLQLSVKFLFLNDHAL